MEINSNSCVSCLTLTFCHRFHVRGIMSARKKICKIISQNKMFFLPTSPIFLQPVIGKKQFFLFGLKRIVTEQHRSIGAFIRDDLKMNNKKCADMEHYNDVWHTAKG